VANILSFIIGVAASLVAALIMGLIMVPLKAITMTRFKIIRFLSRKIPQARDANFAGK